MSAEEINQKVASITNEGTENTQLLQSLTMSMVELNAKKFNQLFDSFLEQHSFEEALSQLAIPFLEKLSLLWLTGAINIVHEQFIHTLIRQKIWAALDQCPAPNSNTLSFLLYLPKGEDQEISILLIYYILRAKGLKAIYLGTGLGIEDLHIAYAIHQTDFTICSFNENQQKHSAKDYCKNFNTLFPKHKLLIIGGQNNPEQNPETDQNLIFEYFDELLTFLDTLQEKKF